MNESTPHGTQQPVYTAPTTPQYGPQPPPPQPQPAPPPAPVQEVEPAPREIIIYSHSPLVYWWPVWVMGYVMAGLTWWYGQGHEVGGNAVTLHPASSLGVLFFLTLFLVIVISNVTVRGYASGMVILGIITVSVLLAYFGLWGPILGWFGDLNVYLNQGAYFWFSTLLFVVWLLTVFVFDRFSYWRIKPGQVTREYIFGAGSRSYDTENLVLEKHRDDLFRHWILGLGSGDLVIHTYGPKGRELSVPNVLFIGFKIQAIQRLIATEPSAFGHVAVE